MDLPSHCSLFFVYYSGIGTSAGWLYPMSKLIKENYISIFECNAIVKAVSSFFKDICLPGALTSFYNPFGESCKRNYRRSSCNSGCSAAAPTGQGKRPKLCRVLCLREKYKEGIGLVSHLSVNVMVLASCKCNGTFKRFICCFFTLFPSRSM